MTQEGEPVGESRTLTYSDLLAEVSRAVKGDRTMLTDYDAPRRTETDDVSEDSLDDLQARRNEAQLAVVDVDESSPVDSLPWILMNRGWLV